MKTLSILFSFLLPFSILDQAQFVAFLPEKSDLAISDKYSEILLTFEVEPHYYIQMDQDQISNDYLIPSTLAVEPIEGLSVCQVSFSKPQTTKLFDANEKIQVLDDVFTVRIEVETSNTLLSGTYPIKGELFYQASDLSQCFPPRKLAFKSNIEVIRP